MLKMANEIERGMEMDVFMAEKVMKWPLTKTVIPERLISFYVVGEKVHVTTPRPDVSVREWSPSTRIADAWDVVEQLRRDGWLVVTKEIPDGFPYREAMGDSIVSDKRSSCQLQKIHGKPVGFADEMDNGKCKVCHRHRLGNIHGGLEPCPNEECRSNLWRAAIEEARKKE